ncbi:MAG: hypothetical protein J0M15_12310 [Deltaproteobacteria bacterium]|jgi:hypothetical protein|nr:hypothetical protein [Deltaproteobacteria bacterium]
MTSYQLHTICISLILGLQFSAVANECVSIYAVNEIAAMILAEANGSNAAATRLIVSPRFSRIIAEQKRRDPDFIRKLKRALGTKPVITVTESNPPSQRKNKPTPVTPIVSISPLNLGEFEYVSIPKSSGLGDSQIELPNGEILALSAYHRGGGPEIVKFKPVVGSDGKITYEDTRTTHGYIDARNNDPKLVSSDTVVVLNYYKESKHRMTFIDLNNLDSKAFQHVPLEKYRGGIDLLPLPDQRILITQKDFGTFSIHDRSNGISAAAFSDVYKYAPNNPKPNTSFPRTSQTELLPNGDLLIGYEIDHDHTYKAGSLRSFTMIQHWIRQSDGTYKPAKDFDVAEYPDDTQNNFLRGGPKVRLVGMKILKNGIVVTAEEPGILKTWKWNQSWTELSLMATEKIFPENVEGNIQTLEVLADGQVLVNTIHKENPRFPVIRIDQNGQMTVTANLPALPDRNHILPLSHGGFYTRSIMNDAWLWTRKP